MECPSVVLLCLLYFWNNWSSAVGGSSTEQVLPQHQWKYIILIVSISFSVINYVPKGKSMEKKCNLYLNKHNRLCNCISIFLLLNNKIYFNPLMSTHLVHYIDTCIAVLHFSSENSISRLRTLNFSSFVIKINENHISFKLNITYKALHFQH